MRERSRGFREKEALSYRAAPEMASGKIKFKKVVGLKVKVNHFTNLRRVTFYKIF